MPSGTDVIIVGAALAVLLRRLTVPPRAHCPLPVGVAGRVSSRTDLHEDVVDVTSLSALDVLIKSALREGLISILILGELLLQRAKNEITVLQGGVGTCLGG